MKILVTGGAGYIGGHTVVELLDAGHEVVVVDNLCNSSKKSLSRIQKITGKKIPFHKVDIRDEKKLMAVFEKEGPFGAAIHFAALKAVGESVQIPLKYYNNNLGGTFTLLKCLAKINCKNIVFSSSATVYGQPHTVPIDESFPTPGCTNPYGWTKLMMEQVFKDVQKSDPEWNIILLRYFNPIGAHKSGLIGEDPAGIPNNLLPYVSQVAVGRLKELSVFGGDYPKIYDAVRNAYAVLDAAGIEGHTSCAFDDDVVGAYQTGGRNYDGYYSSLSYVASHLIHLPMYLATINNITPVIKDATQTMKVTYTIEEA
jgi:UDP-glucose 4-epimerase